MPLAPGTICLITYPFTDEASSKLRPALVADADNPTFLALTDGPSSPALNNINFIQIVGHEEPGAYNIIVNPAEPAYQGTGLRTVSTIRCWNINTIHAGLISRHLGHVSNDLMTQVKEKLRLRLSL